MVERLKILKEIGISIPSENALDILQTMGCKVDRNQKKAFIPEDVVADALKKVVSQYELFDRSGEKSVVIGSNNVAFMSGAAAVRVKDLDGTLRSSTLKDLADMTRLQDSLENLDVMHEIVEALDVDPATFRVDMAAEMLKNTTKPIVATSTSLEDIQRNHHMASMVKGGEDNVKKRPFWLAYIEPISPLMLAKQGSAFLTRPRVADYYATPEETADGIAALFGMITSGAITPHIGGRYALRDVAQAHRDLEARKTVGSSVLVV